MQQLSERTDPYLNHAPTSEFIVRWSARVALAWSVGYLGYRVAFTLAGTSPLAALLLLLAEVLSVAVFALRMRAASAAPMEVIRGADAPTPEVTAVVDATGASIDELRVTLVSCRRVRGLLRVVVVDRDGSRWLRSLAERFDATIADPGVSSFSLAAGLSSTWALQLSAGDLPMPDLLEIAAPQCSAPHVAVIQLGVEEADPTSFEHDPTGRWALSPYEHQVVRPSLARRGSVPWYGDVPALVRTTAISASEVNEQTTSVDLGILVQRNGGCVTVVPATLARVRGSSSLAESLAVRYERQRQLLRVALHPLRGLSRSSRFAHRLALITPLSAVQRVLLVSAATISMVFAQVPIRAAGFDLLVIAVPSYLLRWNAHLLLGRGRLGPFSILRSELRSLSVDLALVGDAQRANRLTALVVSVLALDVAVVVTAVSVWRDWGDRLPASTAASALVITSGFLAIAMEVLLDAIARRQRRTQHRVKLGIVTCQFNEFDAQLVDLSIGGAGIVVAAPLGQVPAPGYVTTLSFRIPDATGAWRKVSALVRVAHRVAESSDETRVGLTFDDPADAPLDAVVEFLTIDRRLVALGRRATEYV